MDAGDARAAFSAAHSLKGSVGNVALTPIYEPVCALTEALRGRDVPPDGCGALAEQIMAAREKALALYHEAARNGDVEARRRLSQ